jgi:WD40 repeat protein
MNGRNRIIVVFLIVIMFVSSLLLAACGSGQGSPKPATGTLTVTPAPIDTVTPEPTLTPTETLFPVPTLDFAEISHRTGRAPLTMSNLDKVTELNMFTHPTGVQNIIFNTDSTLLATTQERKFMKGSMKDEDKPIRVWDLQSGKTNLLREAEFPKAAIFTPDGTGLIFDEGKSKLVIRDIASSHEQSFNMKRMIQSLSMTPDGKMLIMGCWGAIVKLNIEEGQSETVFENSGKNFQNVTISPDGKTAYFIQTNEDFTNGILRKLNLETREVRDLDLVWGNPASSPGKIAMNPDGSFLAVASSFEVILWDIRTDQSRLKLDSSWGIVALSPDGKLFAGATKDRKSIGIWDTESGKLLKTFAGNPDFLTKLAFSPDDTLLASADEAGNVILWGISDQPLNMPFVVIAGAEDSQGLADSISAAWLETPDKPARYKIQFYGSCKVNKTCTYTGGHSLIFRSCSADVTVIDLQTNTTIAEKTFSGPSSTGDCQEKREFTDPIYYQDGIPSRNVFSQWLISVMQEQGY